MPLKATNKKRDDENKIIEFLRTKDFILVKSLGQGACGKTVLLKDDLIDEHFVCKKYSPYDDGFKEELFKNFVQEIKLLHLIYHKNIVRVFNYYLYPKQYAGFIVMEYVNGSDIESYLAEHPENANEVFLQTIEGFTYLEEINILHRDIRPQNLLVSKDGIVKIIDFGFGKRIAYEEDFNKSISLNLWCGEPPNEFSDHTYDFRTEIYFIGKLFGKIIKEKGIESFKYTKLLSKMCEKDNSKRISKFIDIKNEILSNRFFEIEYSNSEKTVYREFSNNLLNVISVIYNGSTYSKNIDDIQNNLENLYKTVMLEEIVPDTTSLINCFIKGGYRYYKKVNFEVDILKSFLILLRQSTIEKKNIIFSNISAKLDSIPRKDEENPDDIPF